MKSSIKFIAILAVFAFSFSAIAQKPQKFGHIDFVKLYSLLPGQDSANAAYETYAKGLQNQFATMQAELENKVLDYQANQASMSDIIKQTKEREIQDLQQRMEEFNIRAQQELANKETELTAPLIEKARKAVEEVAKENGYTYIFNYGDGRALIYAEPSDDIMSLVKKKLNLD